MSESKNAKFAKVLWEKVLVKETQKVNYVAKVL